MTTFWIIVGIIVGIMFGIGISLSLVVKSNLVGDDKGKSNDFSLGTNPHFYVQMEKKGDVRFFEQDKHMVR